jgi:hypothetical protein
MSTRLLNPIIRALHPKFRSIALPLRYESPVEGCRTVASVLRHQTASDTRVPQPSASGSYQNWTVGLAERES